MLKLSFTGLMTVFVLLVGCAEEEAIPRVAENSFELQSARAKDDNPGQSEKDKDDKKATGCTRTIGFWKNHPDVLSPLLPVWLGEADGTESVQVTSTDQAYDILDFNSDNGILKLYAQMLASKLNILSEAPDGPVSDAIAEADAFLSNNGPEMWDDLTEEQKHMVLDWKTTFDEFNNGNLDVPHCDAVQEDSTGGEPTDGGTMEEENGGGSNDGNTGGSGTDEEEESV
jgi:hypothetical protein